MLDVFCDRNETTGDYHMVRSCTSYAIPDRSVATVSRLRINLQAHAARDGKREIVTNFS